MSKVSCSPGGSGQSSNKGSNKGDLKLVAIIVNRCRLYHWNRLFSWFEYRDCL